MSEDRKRRNKKILAIIKLAFLAFVLLGIPLIVWLKYGDTFFSKDGANILINYLQQHRSISLALIICLQVFQVVVCFLPGQPIQIAASYLFGVFPALIISLIGAALGTTVAFFLARLLGYDSVSVLFGEEKIKDYRDKLNSPSAILIVFLIYLIPGVPKDLTAYAAGISNMRFAPFLTASLAARAPAIFGSILFGHFLKHGNYTALIILSVIVCGILLICIIKRKEFYRFLDSKAQKRRQ